MRGVVIPNPRGREQWLPGGILLDVLGEISVIVVAMAVRFSSAKFHPLLLLLMVVAAVVLLVRSNILSLLDAVSRP